MILTLAPEKAEDSISISKIEIRPEHPKPPGNNRFGMIMGSSNQYSGIGVAIEVGQTEVQLVLPAVPCKLLARSDAHNLDPRVHQHNFPPQGEVELTPIAGKTNKVTLRVQPPQIDLGK